MGLQSRAVLLTGAAGGLGRVMTRALLSESHSVAAVDHDADALERLRSFLDKTERLYPIFAELGTESGCTHAIEAACRQFGPIEAVINNAGIGVSAIRPDAEVRHPSIEELTPEIWDRFFAVFVRAPVMLTRLALPLMQKAGFGRIVNNTTSYRTMLRVLPYGSAKAALESMSAVWAKELENSPITVNVLIPGGPTDTPMVPDETGWPRQKLLRPEIMGPAIVWLLSDASAGFNGQRITAARWDASLVPSEAAKRASRAIGWPELAADAVWLT
jgi:NAD(P)-dependent dehydrogenase (short-subunit alcohol dehydrogenase family)